MAREFPLPPSASCLSASMRDLGYSLESAVADIIDNSISAKAGTIEIYCDLTRSEPTLAILDDGEGMTADELLAAMRHGSINPREKRAPGDLGRFGLGLKTASFSQCRRLTVATSKDGVRSAAEWNLDTIDDADDWMISIPDDSEIQALPFTDRLSRDGTLVLWRSLDRLFEDETGARRDEIVNEKLDVVEKHLALVFHRFLAGEIKGRKRLSIKINGHPVDLFDPFCRKNPATQMLPEEIVHVAGSAVKMQPYILPHHSRLAGKDYDYYQSRSEFISNQGAYIYRAGRLMAWGDWFRLIPKGESTKLARVQIDFPTEMDEAWTIDIKKSRARPPHAVRERLRQIIARITNRSETVHRGRGRKLFEETQAPIWERYADQGRIRYALNMSHPLLEAATKELDQSQHEKLGLFLQSISSALPVEMIYSDYSTHPREMSQAQTAKEQVIEKLHALKTLLSDMASLQRDGFRDIVRSTRLFEEHMDIAEQFIEEEFS
ncbi:MAG: ATP-binding protein [Bryobacterales bacterium]